MEPLWSHCGPLFLTASTHCLARGVTLLSVPNTAPHKNNTCPHRTHIHETTQRLLTSFRVLSAFISLLTIVLLATTAGFFDAAGAAGKPAAKAKPSAPAIPEGFFDDRTTDAKVGGHIFCPLTSLRLMHAA